MKWAISYAASAQAFVAVRKLATTTGGDLPLLAVGDPDLSVGSKAHAPNIQVVARGSAVVSPLELSALGELPATHEELAEVAHAFGERSVVLSGTKATEGNFRSQPLSRFNVIHFATHALVREDVPGLSEAALVLTPNPGADEFDDAFLTVGEIAILGLHAKLVILSACNTANLDPQIFGGQIQGLTAAFALAGVPTLIASLWAVDDNAAKSIIRNFAERWQGMELPRPQSCFPKR